MKQFKVLVALVLAMMLTFTLVGSALATTTVTITNAGTGKSYEFKKAFDVTYDSGSPQHVRTYTTDATFANLINTSSCMTATAAGSGEYNIGVTGSAADIRDFLQTNYDDIPGGATTANSGSASLGDGFYVMKVTDGANTVKYSTIIVKGEATLPIIDKNDNTSIPDKKETVDSADYGARHPGMESNEHPTANVGDTITYTVTGTFPMYIYNASTGNSDLVKKLTLTDSITDGLAYVPGTITLTINNATPDSETTVNIPTLIGNENTFTVDFATVNASGEFKYQASNSYTLTYQAKITENAVSDNSETNTVTLTYDRGDDTNIDGGSDTTTVWHYNISLKKVDSTNTNTVLKGAEFDLFTGDATTKTPFPVVLVSGTGDKDSTVNNVYRPALSSESGVKIVVGTTGIIEVKGLKNGNYYFQETKAPDGYNLLNGYTEAAVINNNDAAQLEVQNSQGTELPSTGGIGTTIFYVAGLILVLGAATILVARRKAEADAE